ncbi:fluoride efflux transporter CrcB [Trichlorobacter ammonificans]|uniref:Fluoride-specific ion channel FluC n=1 Tax=Trichlorobacter ammonificans TaxID=2916410 RepID=A0ABM9DB97_9BACT|nr:fluoride efflux transporter CrcB [Trichlorobacter ammonificans]CAH2031947.1 Putative fluoride ion transporter CrcB [Trichlorobacter ammonificans]
MRTAVTIALFCAGGGLARYYLSGWIYSLAGREFPWGTLAVNVIGAFCIGVVMELGMRGTLLPETLRVGIAVGFLGGLTTFSTFSYETFTLLRDGQFLAAFANVLVSVLICLLCTWLGIVTVRSLT